MMASWKPPLLFVTCLFAAAAADAGEDFTDSLLTDLAPILALFGEKVTMQFMSQSTGWADNIILAMAPLGIITIIVAAIRVGGPFWLRSIIGRARENRAVPEAELMSSTSNEVCELWNGQEIVRVMGQGPIREFVILIPESEIKVKTGGKQHDHMLKVEAMELEDPKNKSEGYLQACEPSIRECATGTLHHLAPKDIEIGKYERANPKVPIIIIRNTEVEVPNLALNVHSQVSRAGLYSVAAAGTVFQVGVLTWAGVATYHIKYLKDEETEEPVAGFAFYCMTVGTVLLVLGMLLCASVVEGGSSEERHRPGAGRQARVIWLQKSGTVNDQAFRSFALFPPSAQVMVTTSSRKTSRDQKKEGRVAMNYLGVATTELVTVIATLISIGGFIVQFTGLRALHWSVSVAQLLAILVMTCLRAWVRRNFNKNPQAVPLATGFELDWLAMTLEKHSTAPWLLPKPDENHNQLKESSRPWAEVDDSWDWRVVAVQNPENMRMDARDPDPKSRPQRVMQIRRDLGKLAGWAGVASGEAISLARAIEFTMNSLFNGEPKKKDLIWSLTVSGEPVSLRLSWRDGHWAAYSDELDSILSLWLYFAHEKEQGKGTKEDENELSRKDSKGDESKLSDQWLRDKGTSQKPSLQILGTYTEALYQDLKWWVPDGVGRVIEVALSEPNSSKNTFTRQVDAHRVVGFARPTNLDIVQYERRPPRSLDDQGQDQDQDTALAIESFKPLKELYALHAFCAFMWAAVNMMQGPIEGRVDVKSAQAGTASNDSVWREITLRSTQVSTLAQGIEATGLGNQEEVFLAIMPALSITNKLPRIDAIIEWTREHAAQHERLGQWDEAARVYMWLFQTTRTNTQAHITVKAIALFMECLKEISDVVAIKKRQQYPVEGLQDLEKIASAASKHLEQGGNRKILRAIMRLFEKQGRKWQNPTIEYDDGPSGHSSDNHDDWYITRLNGEDFLRRAQRIILTEEDKELLRVTKIHEDAWHDSVPTYPQTARDHGGVSERDILDWTPLHYAAMKRSSKSLSTLQSFRVDANVRDVRGRTPLHYACQFSESANISTLLQMGAEINIQDRDGRAPIHFAAMYGREPIVQSLIKAGATVDVVDNMGHTPLFWAVYKGHHTSVLVLLESSGKAMRDLYGRTLLHLAVVAEAEEGVKTLMVEALLSKQVALDVPDRYGRSALHLAVIAGDEKVVEQLLLAGASVEAEDQRGFTPLHLAARAGYANLVTLLITYGAEKEAQDPDHCTPLHLAAAKKGESEMKFWLGQSYSGRYEDTVAALLDAGANAEARGRLGQTPLWEAAQNGNRETVDILLTNGADIASKDSRGQTPLHAAASYGSGRLSLLKLKREDPVKYAVDRRKGALVKLLLEKGANSMMQGVDGRTPLHLAAINGIVPVIEELLKQGADIEAKDVDDRTPLHLAAINGTLPVIEELVKQGVDIKAKDAYGMTLLEVAARHGNYRMVEQTLRRAKASWSVQSGTR